MRTATHVHLRMTYSDACMSNPVRLMENADFHRYRRWLLVGAGFDLTRPIEKHGTVFDVTYSQPLVVAQPPAQES